ncbi:hypothetical protein ABZ379_06125 [Streptomyces canus]|uniref:hypothetical protein n=1 Tax=Streptomyces canus TaxID=58343 RepID=UPI0033C7861F
MTGLCAGHETALAELRERLTTLTAEAAVERTQPPEPTAAGSAEAPGDGSASASTGDKTLPDTEDAEGETARLPVAIKDFGHYAGSGWCMVRFRTGWDEWTVLRDGDPVGTVEPEHAITRRRSLLGWKATHLLIPLRPGSGPLTSRSPRRPACGPSG